MLNFLNTLIQIWIFIRDTGSDPEGYIEYGPITDPDLKHWF